MPSVHIQARLAYDDKNKPEEDRAVQAYRRRSVNFDGKKSDRELVCLALLALDEQEGLGWKPPSTTTSVKITRQMLTILDRMENTAAWLESAREIAETLRSIDWTSVRHVDGSQVDNGVIEKLTELDRSAGHMLGEAMFFDEDEG